VNMSIDLNPKTRRNGLVAMGVELQQTPMNAKSGRKQ